MKLSCRRATTVTVPREKGFSGRLLGTRAVMLMWTGIRMDASKEQEDEDEKGRKKVETYKATVLAGEVRCQGASAV